jgi:hypothetical protein
MIDGPETLLRRHLPAPDPQIPELTAIVDAIAADRSIVRVDQLVAVSRSPLRAPWWPRAAPRRDRRGASAMV